MLLHLKESAAESRKVSFEGVLSQTGFDQD